MKRIYKIENTHGGYIRYCLKKELDTIFNSMQCNLRVSRMDELALTPKMSLDDMQSIEDFVSDNIEVTMFDNEDELISSLN